MRLGGAAAAARAAALLLVGGDAPATVTLRNALGRRQEFAVTHPELIGEREARATCSPAAAGTVAARVRLRETGGLRVPLGDCRLPTLGAGIIRQVVADALHDLTDGRGLEVELELEG